MSFSRDVTGFNISFAVKNMLKHVKTMLDNGFREFKPIFFWF